MYFLVESKRATATKDSWLVVPSAVRNILPVSWGFGIHPWHHGPKTRLSGCGAKLGKVIRKMTAIPSEQIIVVAGILLGRGLRLRFEHGNGKQWIVLKQKHVLLRWRFPKCGYRQIIQH